MSETGGIFQVKNLTWFTFIVAVLTLLVTVGLLCFVVAKPNVAQSRPTIVGGKDAPEGKYPYQVSLRYYGIHICGGSILNKRWILTAAHCVNEVQPSEIRVVAGTNLLRRGRNRQNYRVEYISYHEGYSEKKWQNDIAVIRVSKDIKFNDKVQPIDLPGSEVYKNGHPVKLTGWGLTSRDDDQSTPNKLQEIDLKIYDQDKCKDDYLLVSRVLNENINITNSHICTKTTFGEGTCWGDSGSPLVSNGVQVGVASFAVSCALGIPDVFTRVQTFSGWIRAEQDKYQHHSN